MTLDPAALPDDVATLKAMLVAAQAKVLTRDQIIAALKLTISKLQHAKHGASSERGRKLLDQLELQLAELEESVAQDEAAAELVAPSASPPPAPSDSGCPKPARRPLPEHLPRERVLHAAPSQCPDCGGGLLRKLGEDITELFAIEREIDGFTASARLAVSCASPGTPVPVHAGIERLGHYRRRKYHLCIA